MRIALACRRELACTRACVVETETVLIASDEGEEMPGWQLSLFLWAEFMAGEQDERRSRRMRGGHRRLRRCPRSDPCTGAFVVSGGQTTPRPSYQ